MLKEWDGDFGDQSPTEELSVTLREGVELEQLKRSFGETPTPSNQSSDTFVVLRFADTAAALAARRRLSCEPCVVRADIVPAPKIRFFGR